MIDGRVLFFRGMPNQCGVPVVRDGCSCHPLCGRFFGPCCYNYAEFCTKRERSDNNDNDDEDDDDDNNDNDDDDNENDSDDDDNNDN